jgi:hypothetical protein
MATKKALGTNPAAEGAPPTTAAVKRGRTAGKEAAFVGLKLPNHLLKKAADTVAAGHGVPDPKAVRASFEKALEGYLETHALNMLDERQARRKQEWDAIEEMRAKDRRATEVAEG